MKSFIVAACIVACVYAGSVDQDAQVVRNEYEQAPDGSYQSAYETSNGIVGQASAVVQPIGKDEVALRVSGSSSYISPEGENLALTYIADENGYQPQASYLPTPPAPQPIPEYIQRALAYIEAHPYVEKKN